MAAQYTVPYPPGGLAALANTLNAADTGEEGRVNGFWNQVLNVYFPPSAYAIQPELRTDGGANRADFLVVHQAFGAAGVTWRLALPYEGKKGAGRLPTDVEWDNVRNQVFRYWGAHPTANSYAIVGIGRYAKFFQYDVATADIFQRKQQRDGSWKGERGSWAPFDIHANSDSIQSAILFIRARV